MLIIDMPKKYLTDASGFVSCAMCQKYLPLLYRDCHNDFKGCLIKGELPDEHGDLIDRDIMHRELQLWKSTATDTTTMCFLWHVEKLLMCIRPNIAAERKDDGTTVD